MFAPKPLCRIDDSGLNFAQRKEKGGKKDNIGPIEAEADSREEERRYIQIMVGPHPDMHAYL